MSGSNANPKFQNYLKVSLQECHVRFYETVLLLHFLLDCRKRYICERYSMPLVSLLPYGLRSHCHCQLLIERGTMSREYFFYEQMNYVFSTFVRDCKCFRPATIQVNETYDVLIS